MYWRYLEDSGMQWIMEKTVFGRGVRVLHDMDRSRYEVVGEWLVNETWTKNLSKAK